MGEDIMQANGHLQTYPGRLWVLQNSTRGTRSESSTICAAVGEIAEAQLERVWSILYQNCGAARLRTQFIGAAVLTHLDMGAHKKFVIKSTLRLSAFKPVAPSQILTQN
jgi:hypothetical protein